MNCMEQVWEFAKKMDDSLEVKESAEVSLWKSFFIKICNGKNTPF